MIIPELIKKRVVFRLGGAQILLDVSAALFSSFQVDTGTQMLLTSLRKNPSLQYRKVLDLGCGTGAIGLWVQQKYRTGELHMLDRDEVAAAFAAHNALLNKQAAECRGSLDYEEAGDGYSLILFNFPAKLERSGLEWFVKGASSRLDAGGHAAFVVVKELREAAEEIVSSPGIRCVYAWHGKGYSIFHVSFEKVFAEKLDPYTRSSLALPVSGRVEMRTARGLPEFDTLGFGTLALIELLEQEPAFRSVAVLEPGQGHSAVLAALRRPARIALLSRDRLALRFSAENLSRYFSGDVAVRPTSWLSAPPAEDLLLWRVDVKNDLELHLRF